MQPTTFLAEACATDDQLRHVGNVSKLQHVAIDQVGPVVLANLVLQHGDSAGGSAQTAVGANDAHVVPHEATYLVPVLRHDDCLVARDRFADVPVRHIGGCHFGHRLESPLSSDRGAVTVDQAF